MRIGIIETGRPIERLKARHGDYPSMFERLLGEAAPELAFRTFAVLDGELPSDPDACEGWLVTGSAHGVYEDHDWIAPLEAFCRACDARSRPLIGVCFGHQLLAQAFGGTVEKSSKGWAAGAHSYRIDARRRWMVDPLERIAVVVSHQDQVTRLPERAVLLAGNDFCPNALMTIGDSIMGMQCHPEMSSAFSSDLIEARRPVLGDALADRARASLATPLAREAVARWMAAFFKGVR